MMDLTIITGWALIGLSLFLMADATLAAIFGRSYMCWGFNYLPAWYTGMLLKLYDGPKAFLWGVLLTEFAIGFWLFWIVRAQLIMSLLL